MGGYDGQLYVTVDGFASIPTNFTLPNGGNASVSVRNVAFWTASDGTTVIGVAAQPGVGVWFSLGPDYSNPTTW